jgi:hypothetical protein
MQVNAVKNEEASQVSRLNDEIKMLKAKLEGQQANSSSNGNSNINNVDTTELEDKHRQQLKELEEAIKNTWEEKAKISEGYELDRQRLIEDQENAEKQLELTKERNWSLLEKKGDMVCNYFTILFLSNKFYRRSQSVISKN